MDLTDEKRREILEELAIARLKALGCKQHACECGNTFWYHPSKLTACRNCNQVIMEDSEGVIHKAFRS